MCDGHHTAHTCICAYTRVAYAIHALWTGAVNELCELLCELSFDEPPPSLELHSVSPGAVMCEVRKAASRGPKSGVENFIISNMTVPSWSGLLVGMLARTLYAFWGSRFLGI